jgi:predicted PhzF superfamily epimerase YddE/YHI9
VDGGRKWWLYEAADEAALRAAAPDWDAVERLAEATGSMGVCAYARSADPVYYLAVRAFVGAPARFEDAASGAANATLAAWLAERGALPGDGGFYRASQGREVGHDAIIELEVDAAGDVWSGGRCRTVVRGELEWDAGSGPERR